MPGVGVAAAVAAVVAGLLVAGGPTAKPLKPCAEEDGPPPCVWDAKHMGNGLGQSYMILPKTGPLSDGRTVRLTHREAHRLLKWS